jgi:hypothetical protein
MYSHLWIPTFERQPFGHCTLQERTGCCEDGKAKVVDGRNVTWTSDTELVGSAGDEPEAPQTGLQKIKSIMDYQSVHFSVSLVANASSVDARSRSFMILSYTL